MRSVKTFAAFGVAGSLAMGSVATPALAISVELAKKCRAMAIQAHPYKIPGIKGPGTAEAERSYYSDCLAKGGNMPPPPPTQNAPPASAPSSPPTPSQSPAQTK